MLLLGNHPRIRRLVTLTFAVIQWFLRRAASMAQRHVGRPRGWWNGIAYDRF